jgi:hypothetical protein
MTTQEAIDLLIGAGFDSGWVLNGSVLALWEHDQDPPAPLVRPEEATDEAVTTDADTGTSPE